MRNARGSRGSTGATTSGIGEAPSSRLKKFGLIFAAAMIILLIRFGFRRQSESKKEQEQRNQRSGLYMDIDPLPRHEFTRLI